MEQIALSIEQMKHLQELGVYTSGASMAWQANACMKDRNEWLLYACGNCDLSYRYVEKTFTLQDILELLPNFISKDGYIYDLTSDMHNSMAYKIDWDNIENDVYIDVDDLYLHTESDGSNLLKMAFKMLCWVAENGHLKHKEE